MYHSSNITSLQAARRTARAQQHREQRRKGCGLAIRATSIVEGSGVAKSVRELLDDARACETTDLAAARAMAQQARVLARTLEDGAGEAEALYRLASVAYSSGQADDAFADRARRSRARPQGGHHGRRGLGAEPGRVGALQRRQLLRGARVGAAGARAVPPDRPSGRRGQPAEHDRDHPPLARRHRSRAGHLRGRARRPTRGSIVPTTTC